MVEFIRRRSALARTTGLLAVFVGLACSGCMKSGPDTTAGDELKGTISIEGSSTVYPITQAMGVEFGEKHPDVQVAIAGNGTGTGFKKFIGREVEICDASRPISESEIELCHKNEIKFLELQVAIDGLSVVVNKDNDWVDTMTIDQLKQIWDQDSTVEKWSDVNPDWPNEKIELFGPGTESGTFDYFTEVVNGKAKRSRSNYSSNENDNVLVDGVKSNRYALGYFGFAYYVSAKDSLKAVKIAKSEGEEGVAPTKETIEDGTYAPLSRPLFIYVNKEKLKRPDVAAFVKFYLSDEGQHIVEIRKYIRLDQEKLQEMRQRLDEALKAE